MKMNFDHIRNLSRLGVSDIITTKNSLTPIEGELKQHINDKTKDHAETHFNDWLKSSDNDLHTYYLKLHGSLDYYYNDLPLFITGENKLGRIASCPLTQFYATAFEKVLLDHDCKLILIGYGFQDNHINKTISKFLSKQSENDEIHVVDKMDMQKFMKKIDGKIEACDLKNKLKSYHPNGLDARTLASFIEPNLLSLN